MLRYFSSSIFLFILNSGEFDKYFFTLHIILRLLQMKLGLVLLSPEYKNISGLKTYNLGKYAGRENYNNRKYAWRESTTYNLITNYICFKFLYILESFIFYYIVCQVLMWGRGERKVKTWINYRARQIDCPVIQFTRRFQR